MDRPQAWTRQRRFLATLVALSFAVLSVSGLLLAWTYRPVDGPELTQRVHLAAALVMLFFVLILAATLVAERFQRRRTMTLGRPSRRKVAIAVVCLPMMLVGLVTGPWLAWDHVVLRAGTVGGPGMRGLWGPLHEDVRLVGVRGFRLQPSAYQFGILIHAGLPLLIVLPMLIVGVRRAVQWWQRRPEPWRPSPPSRRKQITSPQSAGGAQ